MSDNITYMEGDKLLLKYCNVITFGKSTIVMNPGVYKIRKIYSIGDENALVTLRNSSGGLIVVTYDDLSLFE